MTDSKVPAIYGKIAAIRKEMPTLEKNGVGPSAQGSYKFLSIDDILKAVVPLENKHGVICFPIENRTDFHYNTAIAKDDGRTPKESVQGLSYFVFRYVAIEDGSYIDVPVTGEGIDSQDKATRKATTQAQKIANILTYNLITGEPDPDGQNGAGDDSEKAPNPAMAKARNSAPATKTAALPDDDASYQAKIRQEFTNPGKVKGSDVNEVFNANGKSYKATYEALVEQYGG